MLSSARISADIAVAAARELSAAGWRTPQRLLESTRRQRVDALGRAHYRRYEQARDLGLPGDPDELAALVPGGRCAPLAAALTRARHGLPGLEER
ncbi:hypothetical protein ACIA03_14925 [Nocardioides sp. NPDC051685]|uniref:hypothetical protein n=1 Tax=Nocardioides sp. NPDC051685 TaxID=3364334 RepID=UPI00378C7F59